MQLEPWQVFLALKRRQNIKVRFSSHMTFEKVSNLLTLAALIYIKIKGRRILYLTNIYLLLLSPSHLQG